jgi:hypothetical protein
LPEVFLLFFFCRFPDAGIGTGIIERLIGIPTEIQCTPAVLPVSAVPPHFCGHRRGGGLLFPPHLHQKENGHPVWMSVFSLRCDVVCENPLGILRCKSAENRA